MPVKVQNHWLSSGVGVETMTWTMKRLCPLPLDGTYRSGTHQYHRDNDICDRNEALHRYIVRQCIETALHRSEKRRE